MIVKISGAAQAIDDSAVIETIGAAVVANISVGTPVRVSELPRTGDDRKFVIEITH